MKLQCGSGKDDELSHSSPWSVIVLVLNSGFDNLGVARTACYFEKLM